MHRVPVKGLMTPDNIVNACQVKGMKPVCDYKKEKSKKCKNIGNNWYFSRKKDNQKNGIEPSKTKYAFFYESSKPKLNLGSSTRSATSSDSMGDTFCIAADKDFLKKHGVFKYNDRTITRTEVEGEMTNENIYKACNKENMRPVCDHNSHYDGLCERVGGSWYFSEPSHTKKVKLPSKSLEGAYMYSGTRNAKSSRKHLRLALDGLIPTIQMVTRCALRLSTSQISLNGKIGNSCVSEWLLK